MATLFENGKLNIDTKDFQGMIELMKRADEPEFKDAFFGIDSETGESVLVSVNSDNITLITCQSNGYSRENVYWDNGTVEELYEKM